MNSTELPCQTNKQKDFCEIELRERRNILTFSIITTYILRTQMMQHFLNDQKLISGLMKTLKVILKILWLKPNISKREDAVIGSLKTSLWYQMYWFDNRDPKNLRCTFFL